MLLRKINAVVSLLITVFLLVHAIYLAVWMLSQGRIDENAIDVVPWVLTGLTLIHAFISIDVVVSGLMSEENTRKGRMYPKMNLSTLIQRASGILMILFTGLHIAGAAGYMQPPKLVHGIVPPLFFLLVLAHIAVSTSKAFITLGIGNAKFVKRVDLVMKVVCGVTLIADVVGFYLFVW